MSGVAETFEAARAVPKARATAAPVTLIGAAHPLTGGGAAFNGALARALDELGALQFLSWKRLYPPFLHRGVAYDKASRAPRQPGARFLLDYCDPRTWRAALREADRFGAAALVLPWLHPVSAPPYRYLLRHAPSSMKRVVICHNVVPHEPVPLGRRLTRSVLRSADLLVTHAPHQRDELRVLGLGAAPLLEAFHPRLLAADLAAPAGVAAERLRQGSPDLSLLAYGAVRPYKGVDLALEAMARVDAALRVKLVVAGVFWDGGAELAALRDRLNLGDRVDLRPGYVSNEETALLFSAADASLLAYRSATQSGVAQLSFGYGRPVIATAVGGLPAAIAHGVDGLLVPPDDPEALARAIEELAVRKAELAAGVEAEAEERSPRRYAELLHEALAGVP